MPLSRHQFVQFIRDFNLRELFNELGWNNDRTKQTILIDGISYSLVGVAEKCGLKIISCQVDLIPDTNIRKKLDTQIRKLFFHYILICRDNSNKQRWIVPVKKTDKRELITTDYASDQVPEFLFQKVQDLTFSMEQEDSLTIVDVSKLVHDLFVVNAEKVTKQFYDKFKNEHTSFLDFIKGIDKQLDKDWYASLMLNRLMFCYFVQKKGFLDNNKDYLRSRLIACQEKKGKNKFYSFYRDFLLVLFHHGLGDPDRPREIKEEIGRIPYLNGGLFDEHELETNYQIDIDDKAFERVFDFFDQYEWHLDTRITATGRDINPDVIGYIFEKYINDRADMGAYYTKEDITEYISKNSILPYLMDETKRHYPKAFSPEAEIWMKLKNSGDEYIYDAVKKGVYETLPAEVEVGIKEVSQRNEWNKPAPGYIALPTEIWREVVDRRDRYSEVRGKIEAGEIIEINDFITYNLNIRKFVQDVIMETKDPHFLRTFYKSLQGVTILDPTCGSGAFLFAALNILEPLYEGCIERMEEFVGQSKKGKYKFFEETLEQVRALEHPNLEYFIYKSIILHNLYGVDIMNEAVEIAKLRLFLKLVATVEADYRKENLGLEPLPDIDFNIRAGNTLVGIATENELKRSLTEDLLGATAQLEIEEKCDIVAKAFQRYKEIQLTYGDDYKSFKESKEELIKRLKELNRGLNQLLHKQYSALEYDQWVTSHLPFHWFAEFYEIIHDRGGFDVIIGNPPYVEYSSIRKKYIVNEYSTINSGNLFAFVSERAKKIISNKGYFSFIVPISIVCTQRMESIQKLCFNFNTVWLSNYGERPSKLFTGAEVLITIFIISPENKLPITYSTTFIKWKSEERVILFDRLFYNKVSFKPKPYSIPKIGFEIENNILKKINTSKKYLAIDLIENSNYEIFYRIGGGRYWKIFTDFSPVFVLNGVDGISSRENYLYAKTEVDKNAIISILSSNLFYWYFVLTTNCRDLNPSDLRDFPISIADLATDTLSSLSKICNELMADYKSNSQLKEKTSKKTGNIIYQEFYPKLSKLVIDKIDIALKEHFRFTDKELDFIINFDIKYRMGKELEIGQEE